MKLADAVAIADLARLAHRRVPRFADFKPADFKPADFKPADFKPDWRKDAP